MNKQRGQWGAVGISLFLIVGAGSLILSQGRDRGLSHGSLVGLAVGVALFVGTVSVVLLAGCLSERRRRFLLSRPDTLSAISAIMFDRRDALHRLAHVQTVLEPKQRWIAVSTTDVGLDVWAGWFVYRKVGTLPWRDVVLVEWGDLVSGALRRTTFRVHVKRAGFEGFVDFAPTGGFPAWLGVLRGPRLDGLRDDWIAAAERARL